MTPKLVGPLTVTATAGGQTLAAAFTVAAQAQARRGGAVVAPQPAHGSVAGERAALIEAALAAAAR